MDSFRIGSVLIIILSILSVECQFPGFRRFLSPPTPPAPATPKATGLGVVPNINALMGGQQKLSDACTYLKTRTSIWGNNNAPFKLEIDSFHREVRRGFPIEVAIKPWSAFQPDNFTDFFIYATVGGLGAFPTSVLPSLPPQFLGLFKLIPEYASGGRGFTCDPRAVGPDAFGSAEERRILINRALKPTNQYWQQRQPAIRQYAAALWYPTELSMRSPSIQFAAKVKSDGHWYELKSKIMRPHNPPDPWKSFANSLSQYQLMQQRMQQMQRQMGPPPAKK